MRKDILLVLLHWNDTENLNRIIQNTTHKRVMIYIVNNESNDLLLDNNNVQIIENKENLGFGAAINIGILAGLDESIKFICWCNNDSNFNSTHLLSLAEELGSDNDLQALAPILKEGDKYSLGGRDIIEYNHTRILSSGTEMKEKPAYLPGTVFICKKRVVESIGLLDPQFFFGGEMADYCKRMTDFSLLFKVSSNVIVEHSSSPDTENYTKAVFGLRSRIIYIKKHSPKAILPLMKWYAYILFRIVASYINGEYALGNKLSKLFVSD